MKLGVFVLAAGKGAGGPETYEVELARALARADTRNSYTLYCTSDAARQAMDPGAPNVRCHLLRPRSRWIAVPFTLPLALLRHRIDLFHATYTPPPFAPRPYVFTHHDNSPFDHPEYYDPNVLTRLRPLIRRGLARARHIICPSEFTRRRAVERFGIAPERITVIPHGVHERFRPLEGEETGRRLEQRYGITRPYFFYAGKLQGSKNLPGLLEGYARMLARLPQGPQLVLAGKRAIGDVDLDATLARLNLTGRVRELGHVDTADLPGLYGSARALVFPSLYEGFGLPVLEAMACGTAVLTSSVCALPEVAGDDALLVNPRSAEDIADGMGRLATDDPLVRQLIERGLTRVRRFSWQRHAEATLEVYERAARPAGRPTAP